MCVNVTSSVTRGADATRCRIHGEPQDTDRRSDGVGFRLVLDEDASLEV